jgi:hypothetical protein
MGQADFCVSATIAMFYTQMNKAGGDSVDSSKEPDYAH